MSAWAQSLRGWTGADTVISGHFPVYSSGAAGGGVGAGGGGAVDAFIKAFDWCKSTDQDPAEYANPQVWSGTGAGPGSFVR